MKCWDLFKTFNYQGWVYIFPYNYMVNLEKSCQWQSGEHYRAFTIDNEFYTCLIWHKLPCNKTFMKWGQECVISCVVSELRILSETNLIKLCIIWQVSYSILLHDETQTENQTFWNAILIQQTLSHNNETTLVLCCCM